MTVKKKPILYKSLQAKVRLLEKKERELWSKAHGLEGLRRILECEKHKLKEKLTDLELVNDKLRREKDVLTSLQRDLPDFKAREHEVMAAMWGTESRHQELLKMLSLKKREQFRQRLLLKQMGVDPILQRIEKEEQK
jgi:hypothetical protein